MASMALSAVSSAWTWLRMLSGNWSLMLRIDVVVDGRCLLGGGVVLGHRAVAIELHG
jgi:hypothetical protein